MYLMSMHLDETLARVRPKLVEKVSGAVINQLLDDILKDGILNEGEKDSILQENNTRADRARCLIDMVMRKGCETSRKILTHLQHLEQSWPTLMSFISFFNKAVWKGMIILWHYNINNHFSPCKGTSHVWSVVHREIELQTVIW